MGGVFRDAAGNERYVQDDEIQTALQSGWRPRDEVALSSRRGETANLRPEQLESAYRERVGPGFGSVSDERLAAEQAGRNLEDTYGGLEGGLAAGALGLARGATFTLSDPLLRGLGLVDDKALEGYQQANPGISLATEIGGGVVGSVGTGLARGAMTLGTKLAPGSRAAAYMVAGGAEGMAYGAGQATSSLILRDEPLTAESVLVEYGSSIFLGGAAGAVGGIAGYGLERGGSKLFKRGTERLAANADDVVAANAGPDFAVPLDSAKGKVLADDFVGGLSKSSEVGDELADEILKRPTAAAELAPDAAPVAAAPEVAAPAKPKTIADLPDEFFTGEQKVVREYKANDTYQAKDNSTKRGARELIQTMDEAAIEAVDNATLAGKPELVPLIREVKAARSKLNKLTVPDAPAPRGPTELEQQYTKLKKVYDDAVETGHIDDEILRLEKRLRKMRKEIETEAKAAGPSGPVQTGATKGRNKLYGPNSEGGADVGEVKKALQKLHDATAKLAKATGDEGPIETMMRGGKSELGNRHFGLQDVLDSLDAKAVPKSTPTTPTNGVGGTRGRLAHVRQHVGQLREALPINAVDAAGDLTKEAAAARAYLDGLEKNLLVAEHAGRPALESLLDQAEKKLKGMFDGYAPWNPPRAPVAPEVKALAAEFKATRDELFEKLMVREGKVTKRQLDVFAEMSADEAIAVGNTYAKYEEKLNKLAEVLGPDFASQTNAMAAELTRVKEALSRVTGAAPGAPAGMSGLQMLVGMGIVGADLPDVPGPADEILKLWVAARMLKGIAGKGAPAAAAKSPSKLGGFFTNMLRSGSRGAGYKAAAGTSGGVGRAVRGAVGAHTVGLMADTILGHTGNLARSVWDGVGHTQKVVGRMVETAGKVTRKASPFAPTAFMRSVKLADMDHDPKMTEYQKRAAEIRSNAANSLGLQTNVLKNLGTLAMTHPGVADKIIAKADAVNQFLAAKLPRDPMTVTRFGRSVWKESDQDIARFARYMRAALDPDGELERFADLELSPEGAETLRALYPAKFAKFQQAIAANLPKLADRMSFPEQVQMSVLFGVPVTSLMEPAKIRALQATHAADASAQPVSQPPPGQGASSQLSPAQQLLTR
jgi:hypothetical protein